jgi:hypothetical protein
MPRVLLLLTPYLTPVSYVIHTKFYIFSTVDAFAYSVKYNCLRFHMFDTWIPDSLF